MLELRSELREKIGRKFPLLMTELCTRWGTFFLWKQIYKLENTCHFILYLVTTQILLTLLEGMLTGPKTSALTGAKDRAACDPKNSQKP